jgi:tripartite-type tricarboxylate transporter receptor subunit TctC
VRAILRFAVALCGVLGAIGPLSAHAQGYPSRPVTLVVPFPPGGSTDILARLLGHQLSEEFGQSVIVENRGGAGGSIASEAVARSKPDGHTLMMGHIGTLAVNVGLYSKLGYDPVKSFAPITTVARVANVLVVHPDVPARSVAELIAYAKKNPGGLNFSSGGNGSAAHIAMTAFADAAGLDLVHVPYRGTAPSVTDLIGGRVQMTMTGAPAVLEYVRRGTLRALGVSTAQRLASAPDIPTIAEAGLPGFDASQWYGVVAPAGTPEPIIAKLNAAIRRAMATPKIAESLESDGATPWVGTPDEFRLHIVAEIARWGELIRRANLRLD